MRLIDYIHQGGTIMYILLLLNIIGYTVIISRFLILAQAKKHISQTVTKMIASFKDEGFFHFEKIGPKEIATHLLSHERWISIVKIIAGVSPLLGLLGTVVGVLISFRVMAQSGLNNPSYFAQGISLALITTVGGLIVAIPHFIAHSFLISSLDQYEALLDKELEKRVHGEKA